VRRTNVVSDGSTATSGESVLHWSPSKMGIELSAVRSYKMNTPMESEESLRWKAQRRVEAARVRSDRRQQEVRHAELWRRALVARETRTASPVEHKPMLRCAIGCGNLALQGELCVLHATRARAAAR
jgi:hypothetical protein